MSGKRFRGFMEEEIITAVTGMKCAGFHKIQKEFEAIFIDPPDPTRTREVLYKLYMKEKLDRVRVPSNFAHSPAPFLGSQYIYFIPGTEPDWIKGYVTQQPDSEEPQPIPAKIKKKL